MRKVTRNHSSTLLRTSVVLFTLSLSSMRNGKEDGCRFEQCHCIGWTRKLEKLCFNDKTECSGASIPSSGYNCGSCSLGLALDRAPKRCIQKSQILKLKESKNGPPTCWNRFTMKALWSRQGDQINRLWLGLCSLVWRINGTQPLNF